MTVAQSQPVRGSRFPTLEKYDVLEELGHGGMATVYRARDLRLGRDVAVKVIHPHLRDSAEAVRRFSIEARAVAKLRHPNIVEVYDVSAATDDEQYLVVELLRGVTLRRLLELHGSFPAEVAASVCVELLGALAHAHAAGVIHRDVKPENVILEHRVAAAQVAKDGGTPSAPSVASPSGTFATPSAASWANETPGDRIAIKLTDFGIAKLLDAQGVTSTGQVLGSPAHMAPEQIEGREVDGRADVFGMGVLLYECLVGHLPFQGTNPAQVLRRVLDGEYANAERERPTVGRIWSGIVDRALAPALEERFAGAAEMRDALLQELARVGVTSARGELEAWLDGPEAFAAAHRASMPSRLCSLADAATRRGDALAAAADYNRALAYAPEDATLLRIVARMNRSRARSATLRRLAPLALGALALSVGAVAFRARVAREVKPPPELTSAATAQQEAPPSSVVPVASVGPAQPDVAPSARTLARPVVGARQPPPPPRPTTREVRFAAVEPAQGVSVAVDGAQASPLDPSRPITLDEKAHTLVFSCASDLCAPLKRVVDPGTAGVALSIRLAIKPAQLIIKGVFGNHYFLDDPAHPLASNEMPNEVSMTQSSVRVVTVHELETQRSQTVELHAGKATKPVEFAPP